MFYRTLLLSLFLALQTVPGFGQRADVDSLLSIVRNSPPDTLRVWQLNLLVTRLHELDSNTALKYAEEAKELASLLNYKRGQLSSSGDAGRRLVLSD
jgi:hypothetical protein